MTKRQKSHRKTAYVDAVTRGEGWMPWQTHGPVSPEEAAFRRRIERRKDRMLAGSSRIRRPALLGDDVFDRIERNARSAAWARKWVKQQRDIAIFASQWMLNIKEQQGL